MNKEVTNIKGYQEYLDRKRVIVLPVRILSNFLRNCAEYVKKELKLPKDGTISNVYLDEGRSCLMFMVNSMEYEIVGLGMLAKEEMYLGKDIEEIE